MHAKSESTPADVIFLHGDIYAGATFTPGEDGLRTVVRPRVQALAVRDGRIVAAGSDQQITKFKGKHTQVIDLRGHFVMPGFNDAHLHFATGGLEKLRVSLIGVKSLAEMKTRIAERAKAAEPGEWIVGRGWDHTLWVDKRLPTLQDLDPITGDHPAVFSRVDGHIAVANSAALKAAGYGRDTPTPQGGSIDRDANGEPTGILREVAKDELLAKIPPPSQSQRRRAIELAMQDAAEWGVTSVQDSVTNDFDPTEWDYFLVYEDLEREGKLTVRVTEWLPFRAPVEVLRAHRAHHSSTDAMLRTGTLKAWLDGSLGSRTAALRAPYADDPKDSGIVYFKPAELNQMIRERVAAGFQVTFHAIGDAAADEALSAFAEAAHWIQENETQAPNGGHGEADFRFRIEHAQVIDPDQFAKFRELHVIASVQPSHLLTDMNWAQARLGAERVRTSYPWAEFLRHGVMLAFGTDYIVEPINPFRGIYAAVTRKNEAGTAQYFPEQKLTIDQAIAGYTTGSAYAEFAEREKGELAPGMLADFVVLDRDITKVAPAEILKTHVMRTVVGGKTVYEAR